MMSVGLPQTEIFWCAPAFFPWAIGLVASTTLLLLGVLAARALAGARRAPLRHLIACVGLMGLVALPLISLTVTWEGPASPGMHHDPLGMAGGSLQSGGTEIMPRSLLAIWAVGTAALVLRLVLDLSLLALVARRGSVPADIGREGTLRTLAERVGIRRKVRVLHTDAFDIPCTWGIFRPVILLPAAARTWSRDRVRSVLLHELAHIRRKDGLFALLARVACAVFWFHPLAWWIERGAGDDAERACDSLVVEHGVAPAKYARHLLEVIRDARRQPVSLVPTMASDSQVARRISALTEHGPGTSRVGRAGVAAVLLLVLVPTSILAAFTVPGATVGAAGDGNRACSDSIPTTNTEESLDLESMQSIQPEPITPVSDW